MSSPVKPKRPTAWLSRREMATVFDVSTTYFDRELRPLFDAKHVHQSDGCLSFYSRGCVEDWARAKHATQVSPQSDADIDNINDLLTLRDLERDTS